MITPLTHEQSEILEFVERGANVFFTRSAGTGKSALLREIIKSLSRTRANPATWVVMIGSTGLSSVIITAATGIAACNIDGVDLQSFAGCEAAGIESAQELAFKLREDEGVLEWWLRVIATGGFFQSSQVERTNPGPLRFAFEAQNWSETFQRTFTLTEVFRQTDQEFLDILNGIRDADLSEQSLSKLGSLSREILHDNGIGPTELFPLPEDADLLNSAHRGSPTRRATERYWSSCTPYLEKGCLGDVDQKP
ncbi:DNA helicase [Marasmius tenuissimus]|nr:DNA helicase [Marasmius tenuissimus]